MEAGGTARRLHSRSRLLARQRVRRHGKASAATCSDGERRRPGKGPGLPGQQPAPARPLHLFAQSSWGNRARELTMSKESRLCEGAGTFPSQHICLCCCCSTALPRRLAFKLFPGGPTENNKRIVSFPDGIYFNLYITCNFLLILFLFYFFLNSIFCIRYHYCEEIMLI